MYFYPIDGSKEVWLFYPFNHASLSCTSRGTSFSYPVMVSTCTSTLVSINLFLHKLHLCSVSILLTFPFHYISHCTLKSLAIWMYIFLFKDRVWLYCQFGLVKLDSSDPAVIDRCTPPCMAFEYMFLKRNWFKIKYLIYKH